MDQQRDALREGLNIVSQSEQFLLAIIASVLLSLWSLLAQKDWLKAGLEGEERPLPDLYPPRHTASSINVGVLGFFFCLARQTLASADPDDPVAVRSAQSNHLAALLVLLAALLRFEDVQFLHANGRL